MEGEAFPLSHLQCLQFPQCFIYDARLLIVSACACFQWNRSIWIPILWGKIKLANYSCVERGGRWGVSLHQNELTLSLSILLICIWQRRWRCLHCSSAMQNSFPLSFNYTVIVLGEASSPSAFHQIAIIYESNICQVSQQIHCILQKLISFLRGL